MADWQGWLYAAAVLIPLFAFALQIFGARVLKTWNAYLATGAIASSLVLSLVGFVAYFVASGGMPAPDHEHHEAAATEPLEIDSIGEEVHAESEAHHDKPHGAETVAWTGSWTWTSLGSSLGGDGEPLEVSLGIYVDNLTVIMCLMVSFIATLIHIYSMSYMEGDPRYPRFFAYLSLFCFSMLGLVVASNAFMVFIFWELVGVCSYLLIGHWYEEKPNSDAANKAFVTNRIGDVGMLVGLGLLWTQLGTFNIADINAGLADLEVRAEDSLGRIVAEDSGTVHRVEIAGAEQSIPHWALVLAGLGIFAGCVGKSAQFPLHVWLPDAMAGPTPVSALIHAATMVAAGVYLVGRFFPLFTGEVLLFIAYTGGITLFIAASIAIVQFDYKKVLAYSTVSQLGFMMLALGVGGWAAGLFHLLTHAFFKALLFLGAGSIHHAVHTYDMNRLGGLRAKMPITSFTMLLATMAISGVPFFSGFYSKDAILASSMMFLSEHPGHVLLLLLPAVGAAMTVFYMFRMWFLVFTGKPRDEELYDHAHESGPRMTWPLRILAVPTVMIGWPITIIPLIPGFHPILEDWLAYGEPLTALPLGNIHFIAAATSLLILAIGIGAAGLFYHPSERIRRFDPRRFSEQLGGVSTFLAHKWYFDEVYWALLVRPCLSVARGIAWFDRAVIDGIVDGSARATVGLSRLDRRVDESFVDRIVNLVGRVTYAIGDWSRVFQTGRLRGYLMMLSIAVVLVSFSVYYWVIR